MMKLLAIGILVFVILVFVPLFFEDEISRWKRSAQELMAKRVRVQDDIEYDAINHLQDDIVVLLKLLGLKDCARDISPHEVMVNEIIPAVKFLSERERRMK